MKERVPIAELVSALAAAGLQAAALREEIVAGQRAVIGGVVQIDEHELELRVWIPSDFPLSLPTVLVVNHQSLGFVPHLTGTGAICYHEAEGSVQSLWRPAPVAGEALQLAVQVLKRSLTEGDGVGIVEEMEWWWSRQRGCWRAWRSVFTAGELVKRIQRAGELVFEKGSAVGTKGLPIVLAVTRKCGIPVSVASVPCPSRAGPSRPAQLHRRQPSPHAADSSCP